MSDGNEQEGNIAVCRKQLFQDRGKFRIEDFYTYSAGSLKIEQTWLPACDSM